MKWNHKVVTAIDTKNTTTTSSAVNCELWDGILLTIEEDAATIAGTVEVLANHQSLTDTTLVDANPLPSWVPYGAAFTVGAGGSAHIIEPVPPSIKVVWTRTGGTASVRVQGFTRGD
jgi:hypothetical protein